MLTSASKTNVAVGSETKANKQHSQRQEETQSQEQDVLQRALGYHKGSLTPSNILQLQKKIGNRAVFQLFQSQTQKPPVSKIDVPIVPKAKAPPETLKSQPLQMKWDWVDDTLMGWDETIDGIHWYYDSVSQLMSFGIENREPGYMEDLAPYEGKPRPYREWVEIWRELGWTDGLPAEEEAEPIRIFGSDFPKDRDEQFPAEELYVEKSVGKKIEILRGALEAGYRTFDTAELYGNSTELIFEAARQLDIPPDEIQIIYKVEPEDPETKGSNRARDQGLEERLLNMKARLRYQMEAIPASAQRVIMLHEMPESQDAIYDYMDALNEEMASGEAGAILGLGVSNVNLTQLQAIYAYTVENQLMHLSYVQNRFSPYNLNTAIVNFCGESGITFMGYGVRGGAGLGACKQGYALPEQQLQVLQDQRFLDLALRLGYDPSVLLLAWVKARGVSLVMYSEGHAQENYDALDINLPQDQVNAVNALFEFNEDTTVSEFSGDAGVGVLYESAKDPTSWYILDTLMSMGPIRAVMSKALDQIYQLDNETSVTLQLDNFINKLVRFVTHLQVLKQARFVANWRAAMVDVFSGLVGQIDVVPDLAERVFEWSQSDHMEIGGALHAIEQVTDVGKPDEAVMEYGDGDVAEQAIVVEGAPKVGDSITLKTTNCAMMDEGMSDAVNFVKLAVGTTYFCYFAPDGMQATGAKHNLMVVIIGSNDGGLEAQISALV